MSYFLFTSLRLRQTLKTNPSGCVNGNKWKCHPVQECGSSMCSGQQRSSSMIKTCHIFPHKQYKVNSLSLLVFSWDLVTTRKTKQKKSSLIQSCMVVYCAVSCLDNNMTWSAHKDLVLRSKSALKSASKCLSRCELLPSLLLDSSTQISLPLILQKTKITDVSAAHLLSLSHLPFFFIFSPLLSWLCHVCGWVHIRLLIVSCLLSGSVTTCFHVLQRFPPQHISVSSWSIFCPCTLQFGSLVMKCALTKWNSPCLRFCIHKDT